MLIQLDTLKPKLADRRLHGVLGQVDEELGEAALGSGVVAENSGEGLVPQGLREALSEGLAGAGIVAEPANTKVIR